MQVEVTLEETAVLIRWKKRSDNHVLVRMKTEAVLHASRGVDVGIIAETVERTESSGRRGRCRNGRPSGGPPGCARS